MDFTDSANSTSPSQVECYVTPATEEHETTCWGCGLRLLLSPYAPIFKCGWCGAITNQNPWKHDNKHFWWRRLRDACFVCFLIGFMLAIMGGGIWAIYPIVFYIGYFCGILHFTIAIILSVATLSTYSLAAFRSPGAPPVVLWGTYPTVGRGGLNDYTFCHYCSKPKSPNTHHCRSCGMCVLDMDHHCPFIGNCVGAANHRSFIYFLIAAVISTIYVSIISAYAAYQIWPPLSYTHLSLLSGPVVFGGVKEIFLAFFTSVQLLPVRGFVLVYLVVASISVEIGLSMLLWQQLCYIYEGKTYLSHLSSMGSDEIVERDCHHIFRFFGFPFSSSRFVPSFWNSKKSHKK